jgi:hypothetical protein
MNHLEGKIPNRVNNAVTHKATQSEKGSERAGPVEGGHAWPVGSLRVSMSLASNC